MYENKEGGCVNKHRPSGRGFDSNFTMHARKLWCIWLYGYTPQASL